MKPNIFNITTYTFEPEKKKAFFYYSFSRDSQELHSFVEEISFPKAIDISAIPKSVLEETLKLVHITLGISYYKLFVPSKISVQYSISKKQAGFFKTLYKNGLGEFFYRNNISPNGKCSFLFDEHFSPAPTSLPRKQRALFGVGGGKDSIVVGELLKEQNISAKPFIVETQKASQLKKDVLTVDGRSPLKIRRKLDTQLFNPPQGSFNGHIPISAVIASLSVLTAVLYDYNSFIVGNEFSSNFGNINWKGLEVNHQWSKSQEFESLFQNYLNEFITPDIKYFSLLRPLHEIRIAEMFTKYPQYFNVFSSCNRNFLISKERTQTRWCIECPKCHFVFLMLAPFLSKKDIQKMFGKNLFDDAKLIPAFKDLLGFGDLKPFDCVGTFEESQAALYLASKKYNTSPVIKKLVSLIKKPEAVVQKVMGISPAPNLPEYLQLMLLKNCALIGYGLEGTSSHTYLQKFHPKIKIGILDQNKDKNYLHKQSNFEFAIKTPSIPKEKITLPYSTATNIFMSKIKSQNIHTIIGITGTKGKSTTTSLIYSMLKEAKLPVHILGNIGNPMIEYAMKNFKQPQIFVVEFSSYQLNDCTYSPDIAVCINLYPEHLNHHGSEKNYYNAKFNITAHQNFGYTFIYNDTFSTLKKWSEKTSAHCIAYNNSELPQFEHNLLGEHNQNNIQAAYSVAQLFDIPRTTIKKALKKFKPLEHRLEYVGTFNDIQFYNDANATTPEATIMALQALPNTETIFLGGQDRGYNFTQLQKLIKKSHIKNIVLFPDTGTKIITKKSKYNILQTTSMKEAVQFAYDYTSPGKTCLLSCASPSYSLWKNFKEKGNLFKKYIRELK